MKNVAALSAIAPSLIHFKFNKLPEEVEFFLENRKAKSVRAHLTPLPNHAQRDVAQPLAMVLYVVRHSGHGHAGFAHL